MEVDEDHDFMDTADRVEAQRETRRVSAIGIGIAAILALGLVALLMYGRILTDDAAVVSAPPAVVTTQEAPPPATPPTNAP